MNLIHFLSCFFFFSTSLFAHQSYFFHEIWAYVLKGEENWIDPQKEVTDVLYFSLKVDEKGRIQESLLEEKLRQKISKNARLHCVISSPGNRSLMHWCLGKDEETKNGLISDILEKTKSFDGVQIDFETILPEDQELYFSFLKELKEKLDPKKIFSVAVPARTAEKNDAFSYSRISEIADKVLIMAYDEHWRTGPPGAIASAAWCQKVLKFAQQKITPEKLVMGIPLYGRVWQKEEIARALKYFQTLDLWKEVKNEVKRENDDTPFFSFEKTVQAVVFYEDLRSLEKKLNLYQQAEVQSIGLWRLSQEPQALWKVLSVQK